MITDRRFSFRNNGDNGFSVKFTYSGKTSAFIDLDEVIAEIAKIREVVIKEMTAQFYPHSSNVYLDNGQTISLAKKDEITEKLLSLGYKELI